MHDKMISLYREKLGPMKMSRMAISTVTCLFPSSRTMGGGGCLHGRKVKTQMHTKGSFFQWTGLLLFVLLLLPAGALAARINDLWVTNVMPGQERLAASANKMSDDALRWWYSSNEKKYYLFLPAGTDTSNLRLWFKSAAKSLTVDGQIVSNGDRVDFLKPNSEIDIACGSFHYRLAVMQSENIPALFITTASGNLERIHSNKNNQETGTLAMLCADGSVAYDGPLDQIKCRGNATFFLNKKPYQIKLGKSTNLCGMGKSKTWVLLANHHDNSLLRNSLAFALAQAVGIAYTSMFQQVDLYINNEYYGTYLLCEKVEIGTNRVNIPDLEKATEALNEHDLASYPKFGKKNYAVNQMRGYKIPVDPPDITGGYLLELEYGIRYKNEPSAFVTKRGQSIVIKSPKYASQAQVAYIRDFMQGFENAIFAEDGIDPISGKHYSEFVDMESLVKKYLLEEVIKNYDGNRSSQFFYKPPDDLSPLAMAGPPWDYDSSMGNYTSDDNPTVHLPELLYVATDSKTDHYWYPQLFKKVEFQKAAIQMYHSQFAPALKLLLGLGGSGSEQTPSLDDFVSEVEASAAMNFVRWPIFNHKSRPLKTGANYKENIEYVRSFLSGRLNFLNEAWKQEP